MASKTEMEKQLKEFMQTNAELQEEIAGLAKMMRETPPNVVEKFVEKTIEVRTVPTHLKLKCPKCSNAWSIKFGQHATVACQKCGSGIVWIEV